MFSMWANLINIAQKNKCNKRFELTKNIRMDIRLLNDNPSFQKMFH